MPMDILRGFALTTLYVALLAFLLAYMFVGANWHEWFFWSIPSAGLPLLFGNNPLEEGGLAVGLPLSLVVSYFLSRVKNRAVYHGSVWGWCVLGTALTIVIFAVNHGE